MLITPQFVEALRSAALVFQTNQPIRHVSDRKVLFGTLAIVAYNDDAFGLEDARSGRRIAEIVSALPLSVITVAIEFFRMPPMADAILPPDPRQIEMDFSVQATADVMA